MDAELIRALLQANSLECAITRVDTRSGFEAALAAGGFHLILSDFTLPGFDGMAALDKARALCPDVPFLFVSGTIGEERAVEGLKRGATDFVIKDRFARLAPAIRRALEDGRERAARRDAEQALRRSEERYALAATGANDGLWDWDLDDDKVFFSARWKGMLGFSESEVGERLEEWLSRVHTEDLPGLSARLRAHLDGDSEHFECEYRIAHRSSGERWMLCRGLAVRAASGRPMRMAGSQTDITERKRAEQQLRHDALHDPLSGLPNRASFLDRLGQSLAHARRRPTLRFGVLFLDLDRFKIVNDSLGHAIGDELLVAVGRRLEGSLRGADTVARLGGDEFVLLLHDIEDVQGARLAAVRIQRVFDEPFQVPGHEVFASASIGIALSQTGYARPEDMVRDADIAMYRAKASGPGRHEIFDRAMHARALHQLRLENDLRRSLATGGFQLYYQPVVRIGDGAVVGLEALLRWQHPERGILRPAEFLVTAEEAGLLAPLGRWGLEEGLRQMQAWAGLEHPPGRLNVNLSPRQLNDAGLVDALAAALRAHGVDGDRLGVEITETALMEARDDVQRRLLAIKQLGAHLILDDFGTGYSSLSYLHRFPIDELKIDMSFVSQLESDPQKAELVRSIVAIGKNLRKKVVAEGVETAAQRERLVELGCEYGQGYYWARPVAAEQVPALL